MRSGRPLKVAVTVELPMKVVKADSTGPVIVVTRELVVEGKELDVVVWEVRFVVSKESTEKVLTPGEQPTKLGADSFTELQVAMLNSIASGPHQCLNLPTQKGGQLTSLVRNWTRSC